MLQVDPSLGIRRNRYAIPEADMTKIFEPIMKDILCLIQEQVRLAGRGVAAVLLVGGFGSSNFLKNRVATAVGPGVAVLQPENGWTAVVRGAAMLGVGRAAPLLAGVNIASRIARKHYGVELTTPYDSKKHDKDKV